MNILLFGGTSEGRDLALWLAAQGHGVTLCVATEYGADLVPRADRLKVHTGRLEPEDMDRLLAAGGFHRVVDATHPYAVMVTEYVRAAAERAGVPYHRLLREGLPEGDWLRAADLTEAAELVKALPGNLLLTTGAKELAPFAVPGLVERTFPRVLPSLNSLERCLELGFPPAHILCMQGPFSQSLNEALLGQYNIQIMVTKASGGAGGFWEKVAAAKALGCTLIVVDRPAQLPGMGLEDLKTLLKGEPT